MVEMLKSKIKKRVKIAWISVVSLLGLLVLLFGVVSLLLTPSYLTPIVNKYATRYLNATVHFDTVDVSWWDNFPLVTLRVTQGSVVSKVFREVSQRDVEFDTLVSFRELKVSTDLISLINSKFITRRIAIKGLHSHIYVDSTGRANYDIYTPGDTDSATSDFVVKIDRIALSGGVHISYDNQQDSLQTELHFERLGLNGTLTDDLKKLRIDRLRVLKLGYTLTSGGQSVAQNFDSIRIESATEQGYRLDLSSRTKIRGVDSTLAINLNGWLAYENISDKFSAKSLRIDVGGNSLTIDGDLTLCEGDSIRSDLNVSFSPLVLSRLKSLLPNNSPFVAIQTDIQTQLNTKISGCFTTSGSLLPRVELAVAVDRGSLRYPTKQIDIRNIHLDARCVFDPISPRNSGVRIDTINIDAPCLNLNGRAQVNDIMGDPEILASIRGALDVDELSRSYPLGVIGHGKVSFTARGKFCVSELKPTKIDQVDATVKVSSDDLLVRIPSMGVHAMAHGLSVTVGSNPNTRDSLIAKGRRIVRLSVRADTAHFALRDTTQINLRSLKISARSAASKYSGDTTSFHPFTGSFTIASFTMSSPDSAQMRITQTTASFTAVPLVGNVAYPEINFNVNSKRMSVRDKISRYSVQNLLISAKAIPTAANSSSAVRRTRRLDSLQMVYPDIRRDSLLAHAANIRNQRQSIDEFAKLGNIDMTVDDWLSRQISKWSLLGKVSARSIRAITPRFPLKSRINNLDMDFTLDNINLHHTQFLLGESNITVDGNITNIRRALAGRGSLIADVTIKTDTLNMNQLIQAANLGASMVNNNSEFESAQSEQDLQQMIDSTAKETMSNALVIIPSNIQAVIRLDAREVKYSNMQMHELVAELELRDRCMQISYLLARTSLGEISTTCLYATRSRDDIRFAIDFEMNRVNVGKFIEALPELDTLYPMLRSLDGVVDCRMAATASLDTLMNVKLETLNGAAHLSGSDMVLLDGETFSEIAKMLKFKNRKRNQIDGISLEMLIHDRKIETFPFVFTMDRYRIAASGVHNMDLTFNYHISVLKSPLPFRLGIDVFGNMDDFDFKIVRARYKNDNIPSHVQLIEDTRINLRRNIGQIFQNNLLNADISHIKAISQSSDTVVMPQQSQELTAADSLVLRQSGIIP